MYFLLSRVYALAVIAAWGWLGYAEFKARSPTALVVTIFLGAFLMRASTSPVFDWGEGSRRWDSSCKYALVTGVVFIVLAAGAVLLWLG